METSAGNEANLLIPKTLYNAGILYHKILILYHSVCELAAVARAEGEDLSVGTKVPLLQLRGKVQVVLRGLRQNSGVIGQYLRLDECKVRLVQCLDALRELSHLQLGGSHFLPRSERVWGSPRK